MPVKQRPTAAGNFAPAAETMWTKLLSNQQRIDTQVSQGWSIPWETVKPSDESRTSTTLANDGDLQFTAVPAGTYKVELDLIYSGGAGASEGDLKIDFNIPTGTLNLTGVSRLTSDTNLHQVNLTAGAGISLPTNGLSVFFGVNLRGLLATSASGTFVFRWACVTNTGTSSRVLTNSRFMIARRI